MRDDWFDVPRFTEQAEREMREWGVDPIEYCNITAQNIHEILVEPDYEEEEW